MSQQCLFWLASSACVLLVGARTVTWKTPHGSTVVRYDAGASGLNVQAHDSVHELPSGRLLQDVDEGRVTITVNPDEFYLAKTDTGVTLYGSEIDLADYYGTGLWDPYVELTVFSYKIKLPKHMQFERPLTVVGGVTAAFGVHLHAAVLEAHPEGSTINISGHDADDQMTPEADGAQLGSSGANGRAGTNGALAGNVNIEAGTITGELTVLANGGNGGRGGRGGDGRRGEHGIRASETACCQENPNLAGSDGQPGGNGGNGGNGGAGAAAGLVQIRFKDGDSANITVENSTGLGGEGGYPGIAGDGGRGGLGAMVIKKSVNGICYCTGDPGPSGQDGADGQDGTAGTKSSDGPDAPFLVDQVQSLSEVRKGSCGQHLRYENFYGDQMFIQGNFDLASTIYSWVQAVLGQECDQGMSAWEAEASLAGIKQQQLGEGFDYYNFRQNHVPQVNIDSLMVEAASLLDLAKHAETSYDLWIAQSTEDMSDMIDYTEQINLLDIQVSTNLNTMNLLGASITGLLVAIRAAQEKVAQIEAEMMQTQADCQAAVQAAVLSEEYAGPNTFARLRDFSKNSLTTSASQLTSMGQMYGQADAIYQSGASLTPEVWSIASPQTVLDYMNSNAGGLAGGFQLENVLDINPLNKPIQTFINQVQGFQGYPTERSQDVAMRQTFRSRWDSLWAYWAENKENTVARVLLYQSQATYDSVLDDFTAQIPDCAYMKETFKSYQAANQELSGLLQAHDGTAASFGTRRAIVIKAREDRKMLEMNRFLDPTSPGIAKSMADSYRSQKDDVIYVLKNVRGLLNFKFCESRPFTYNSMRIAQLENVLATMHEENLEKTTDLSAGLGVLAKNPATIITRTGPLPEAVVAIDITPATAGSNWDAFVSEGKITFTVDADNDALPRAVSNLHIIDVQAFFPDLQGGTGLNQIWVQKTGASKCFDAKGAELAFTHPPQVYTSISDHSGGGSRPKFLSHTMLTGVDSTGPSPLGSWSLHSQVANRDTISSVTILLILSYRSLETVTQPSGGNLMA